MLNFFRHNFFRSSPADRRLLPEGRMAGPMPWVIAIMMFLTVLAAAAGLTLGGAARGLSAELAGRLTVQLPEPDAGVRAVEVKGLLSELGHLAGVRSATAVPEAQLVALLKPWLGETGIDSDLPLPALIDVDLTNATPQSLQLVRQTVAAIAPNARVDEHALWLSPLSNLLRSLTWLSLLLVALMTLATAAVVVLASRAALNTHRATIEVMHLLGASDVQVARLFQRRIALDALVGGVAGLIAALVVMLLIGNRMQAMGSELLGDAGLGWMGWLLIAALPVIGVVLSMLSARLTVVKALRKIL